MFSGKVVENTFNAFKKLGEKRRKKFSNILVFLNLLVCHGPCAAKFFKYFRKNVGKVATTENFWEKKN